jgi:nucleoside-diphosphate-sugar epimerase
LLAASGYRVRAATRSDSHLPEGVSDSVVVGELGPATDWREALRGVDCVVHAAARVHVMKATHDSTEAYTSTNALATKALAAAAAAAGVRRLVFVSTIKVNGGETSVRAYTPTDPPAPVDAYGRSKWLAEQLLAEIAAQTALEVAIVRPPLVYGPGVRANFLRLVRWVEAGVPLPLGAIDNRRSLVSAWNLSDLIASLLTHAAAPGRAWLVTDGEDLSTPELVRRLARALGRRPRLLPVPPALLRMMGTLTGQEAAVGRLCGSLRVDMEATRRDLGWSPPLSVDEGLQRTIEWYRTTRSAR